MACAASRHSAICCNGDISARCNGWLLGDRAGLFAQQATVKHFTTFGVAQTDALSATPTPGTADASSGLGAGAIAGIVIGAIVGKAPSWMRACPATSEHLLCSTPSRMNECFAIRL
jgi:hypothetical protein